MSLDIIMLVTKYKTLDQIVWSQHIWLRFEKSDPSLPYTLVTQHEGALCDEQMMLMIFIIYIVILLFCRFQKITTFWKYSLQVKIII